MTSQHLSDIHGYAAMRTAEIQHTAAARRLSREAALTVAPKCPWYTRFRFTLRRRIARQPATVATLPAPCDESRIRPAA